MLKLATTCNGRFGVAGLAGLELAGAVLAGLDWPASAACPTNSSGRISASIQSGLAAVFIAAIQLVPIMGGFVGAFVLDTQIVGLLIGQFGQLDAQLR